MEGLSQKLDAYIYMKPGKNVIHEGSSHSKCNINLFCNLLSALGCCRPTLFQSLGTALHGHFTWVTGHQADTSIHLMPEWNYNGLLICANFVLP